MTQAGAATLAGLGPEAVTLALMAASVRLAAAAAAAAVDPARPSGMVPVYERSAADRRRRKSPGAKPGHAGSRRELARFRDCYFTSPAKPHVPPDNNPAERQVRPAVIQRKTILCNRSADGADVQAVLMSICRTLRLRGHDPTPTIVAALRELISTGKLPPLPEPTVADG